MPCSKCHIVSHGIRGQKCNMGKSKCSLSSLPFEIGSVVCQGITDMCDVIYIHTYIDT